MRSGARLIAFYLPQFHPIPENDAWWGEGFTEWTNVVRATPQFSGHDQPHLPADLGFYDLRVPEVRQAQADLAREFGIHGFCYYHYWFRGKRLLERPFDDVRSTGKPDFPFCLCWANENWTRVWDGGDQRMLLEQTYSQDDDLAHIRWLVHAFRDPRYLRIAGKPLFLVYRAGKLPDPLRTVSLWRSEAARLGVGDLFLCRVENFGEQDDPTAMGFDAAVEFQPEFRNLGRPLSDSRLWRLTHFLKRGTYHRIYDYPSVVERMLAKKAPAFIRFPCVTPCWDNTARRQRGAAILTNSSPDAYEQWLRRVLARVSPERPDENLVFVNAWNEWAEGNHLEPGSRWGRAYLEATKRAVDGAGPGRQP